MYYVKTLFAMNLGEAYLVTETGNERLGKQKLDLSYCKARIKSRSSLKYYLYAGINSESCIQ